MGNELLFYFIILLIKFYNNNNVIQYTYKYIIKLHKYLHLINNII